MSVWQGDTYHDSVTVTRITVAPVALAVRGVVQVTLQRKAEALAVRMGPAGARKLARLIEAAADRAEAMP